MPKTSRPVTRTKPVTPNGQGDHRQPSQPRPPRPPRPTSLAAKADPFALYQRAVQAVDAEIDFVDATFTTLRKRKASLLREDFCASANTACEWVRRRSSNHAVGLDIEPKVLTWGRENVVAKLSPAQRQRVTLLEASVLDPQPKQRNTIDIVLAMNFSYWCFSDRATLVQYFSRVREALANDGVFFLDYFGGSDSHKELKERRTVGGKARGFTYIWEQARVNPITGAMICKIHFAFRDGSRINDAFTYHWRLWGLREIRDVLQDAGFSKSIVYWEGDDNKGGGNGVFSPTEEGEACPGYIGYIAALK